MIAWVLSLVGFIVGCGCFVFVCVLIYLVWRVAIKPIIQPQLDKTDLDERIAEAVQEVKDEFKSGGLADRLESVQSGIAYLKSLTTCPECKSELDDVAAKISTELVTGKTTPVQAGIKD